MLLVNVLSERVLAPPTLALVQPCFSHVAAAVECVILLSVVNYTTGLLYSIMKLCCQFVCFVMLGILVHYACGLEKDDPRLDSEYPQSHGGG